MNFWNGMMRECIANVYQRIRSSNVGRECSESCVAIAAIRRKERKERIWRECQTPLSPQMCEVIGQIPSQRLDDGLMMG